MKNLSPRPKCSECKKGQSQRISELTGCRVGQWPLGFMPSEVRASATLTQASRRSWSEAEPEGPSRLEAGSQEAWDSSGFTQDAVSEVLWRGSLLVPATRTHVAEGHSPGGDTQQAQSFDRWFCTLTLDSRQVTLALPPACCDLGQVTSPACALVSFYMQWA